MPLKTVLLRHLKVLTLVLGHLDLPGPGDARVPGVHVDVDLVAGVGGGDKHVLAGVNSADDRRNCTPRVANSESVSGAVSHQQTPFDFISICPGTVKGYWGRDAKGLIINPELANVRVRFAECVGAGVWVRADCVGCHGGVGVVLAACAPA